MMPAILQKKGRKEPLAEDPIDPYELVRRLSIIQAEETRKELERRRTDWETELLESRGVRHTQILNRALSAPNVHSYNQHRRSASISLAPNQIPPLAYTDLPEPVRKQSLPFFHRPQYAATSRRSSLKRGDSVDLETINENAVEEPTAEDLVPERTENQQRRMSSLPRVDEDSGPEVVNTQRKARGRSSVTSQSSSRQQHHPQSEGQSTSRRRSSSAAQKELRQKEESGKSSRPGSRSSSLLEKLEQHGKPDQVEVNDSDAFDSKASTLRNSWRSSTDGSTSSRRSSLLKKIGNYGVMSTPSLDEPLSVKKIDADTDDSVVNSTDTKRKSKLFSKLRH